MITAQDIREKTFEKAKFNNGYDMNSVDEFLEVLADEITAAQKENSVLKSKMKVLAAKIEEYRAQEEALNQALLAAQKLALQIETEARARAAAIIAEAQAQVDEKIGNIEQLAADQEQRLAAAQAATAKFCQGVREMCLAQIGNIDAIEASHAPAAVEEAAVEEEAVEVADDAAAALDDDIKLADDIDSTRSFSF